MIRKVMFVLSILALLGLMTSKSANAKDSLPTWDVSFNPGKYMTDTYYLIHAVEEYKGDLYAVAGDPMWFDLSDPSRKYGQVFRSPDGENWHIIRWLQSEHPPWQRSRQLSSSALSECPCRNGLYLPGCAEGYGR